MSDPLALGPVTLSFPAALAVTLALGLLLVPAGARAQVSPGPLARAHEALDGPSRCLTCHARAGGMTQRCLDCHTGIAAQRAAGRGLHGREARTGDCAGCHPDHAGRGFDLIRWDEGSAERFDHRRAGYPLTGKHASLACQACHRAKFQRPAATAPGAAREPSRRWLGLGTDCESCHDDPHRARFGRDCTKCHDTGDWKRIEARRFDHDLTRYPLRGKHAAVRCEACHLPQIPAGKQPPFDHCGSCHRDAHAGQATIATRPADCAACHTVEGFTPSTFTVAMHQRSAYRLEGRHARVACAGCHPKRAPGPAAAGLGPAGVVLRPRHDRCVACHADAHGRQLAARADRGACEACHRVDGWKPSTYTVGDHARTALRLEGAHERAACASCHAAKRRGLRPVPAAASLGVAAFAFRLPERGCLDCHHDPHRGRYGPKGARPQPEGCPACHDAAHWRPARVTVASHARLGHPLEEAHRAVPCSGCHEELRGRPGGASLVLAGHPAPLRFDRRREACADCHADVHQGQFVPRRDRGACDACHDLAAWRPAARFAHDRDTRFRLEGAHAKVPCAACHPTKAGAAGRPRVVYRGAPLACAACHAPARGGEKGVR